MDVKCGRQRSYAFSGVKGVEEGAKKISQKNFFIKKIFRTFADEMLRA